METKPTPNPLASATVATIIRTLLGLTLLFSGFVKAVDPNGTLYKIEDYLIAFGWQELFPLAPIAVYLLVCFEFVVGATTLLGVYQRINSRLVLLFMSVMTLLTLYIAIANPVSDCGCFGDAIHLSNGETLAKNIVLLACAVYYCLYHKRSLHLYTQHTHWLVLLYTTCYVWVLIWVGFHYLPLLDFRPYKSGSDLLAATIIPEGAPVDEYETTLVYERGGERQHFTLENYPANDTTWHFVETQNRLIKQGYRPPITDFALYEESGEEVTQALLTDTTYTFLLLSNDLTEANDWNVSRINEIYDYCQDYGYHFYGVTPSSPEEIETWRNYTGAEYPMLFMDKVAIKTVARANPSMLLLKEGKIVWKRSTLTLPSEEVLTTPLDKNRVGEVVLYDSVTPLFWLITIFTLPLLLLFAAERLTLYIAQITKSKKEQQEGQIPPTKCE